MRRHLCELVPEPLSEPGEPWQEAHLFAKWAIDNVPQIRAAIASGRGNRPELAAVSQRIWKWTCYGWKAEWLQRNQHTIAEEWRQEGYAGAASLLAIGKVMKGPLQHSLRGPIPQTAYHMAIRYWDDVLDYMLANQRLRGSWVSPRSTSRILTTARACMRCRKPFQSTGPGNRLCRKCGGVGDDAYVRDPSPGDPSLRFQIVDKFLEIFDAGDTMLGDPRNPGVPRRRPGREVYDTVWRIRRG
mgnify:CR=1 FL=1